nr:hypothetical protein [Tanacetum cinerariifolium]
TEYQLANMFTKALPEDRFKYLVRRIGNKSFLLDYQEYNGGFVAFAGSSKGGKITGKDFKLPDENQVLLKVPRKNNMYSFDLKNVVPSKGLTCLFTKATNDESNLWHMRKWFRMAVDIDSLTNLMNYQPVSAGNRTNGITCSKIHSAVGQEGKEKVNDQEYILLPVLNTSSDVPSSNEEVESSLKDDAGKNYPAALDDFSKMPNLEDTGIFDDAYVKRIFGYLKGHPTLRLWYPKDLPFGVNYLLRQ